MLRKFVVVCVLVLLCSMRAAAQEPSQPSKVDIFGGYQYLHANSGVSGVDGLNFNGWNAAVSGYFTRNFRVTADFSGNYAKPSVLGVSVDAKFYTFLFGPTVRVPTPRMSLRLPTRCLAAGIFPQAPLASADRKLILPGRPAADSI